MMTFPPTTGLDNITFVAPVVSENIHEVDEFFFVQARFGYDNSQDLNDFNSGEDTALFFILNDDGKWTSLQQRSIHVCLYSVHT